MASERSLGGLKRFLLPFDGQRLDEALAGILPSPSRHHPLGTSGAMRYMHESMLKRLRSDQVSLQVICWPLTRFTVVRFFGYDDLALPAWIVCSITAAISNTIQIW